MRQPLADLGITMPVLAAPMAGEPGTPSLAIAAARVGSLGFVAGGYKSADAFAAQIAEVRAQSARFGVNLFAPNPMPVDPDAFRAYARAIQPDAGVYGLHVTDAQPREDDDNWHDKIEVLRSDPVPLASFTFGIPDAATVQALHRVGTVIVQTVTSVDEARIAAAAGVDVLAVQASTAGGHSGTLTPHRLPAPIPIETLLGQVRADVDLPIIAAGGLASPGDISAVLAAGADAAMVGTVLLRSDEAGTSEAHRAALADPARTDTVVTRAFTGRPARGLRNGFIDRYDTLAPLGYPALHHLTSQMRKAAAAAGDAERIHLWAGTGYRHATAEPAGQILARLAERL